MGFATPWGWYAFAALIPLILLYFIRPKPKKKVIPSLMFFAQNRGFLRRTFFIRNLLHNLLLLLHILIISLLAFSLTSPFLLTQSSASSENTVLVIDGSASMQAALGSQTRFDKAIDTAKGLRDGRVSIVLASTVPLVLLDRGGQAEAGRILDSLEALDTGTNLGDAMLAAADVIAGEKGRVYVLSDFRNTQGPDPIAAKRVLLSQGLEVEFVNLISAAQNVGIVGLDVGRRQSSAKVRNYDDEPRSIALRVAGEQVAQKLMLPRSTETFSFDTPQGATQLELLPADDFAADNTAFISAPDTSQVRVLLITNKPRDNLATALSASPEIDLAIAEPPVVPNFEYPVIVVGDVNPELMLPGFYEQMKRRVSDGAHIIITAQSDSEKLDTDLLPVTLNGLQAESVQVDFGQAAFTRHVEAGPFVSEYFLAQPKDNAAVLARTQPREQPMLVLRSEGKGSVVFYGIIDQASTFKSSTDYPIFWNQLVLQLVAREDLSQFNINTGQTLVFDEQQVQTPSGRVTTSRLIANDAGFYEFDSRSVAVNLLSSEESAVSGEAAELLEEESELVIEQRTETEPRDYTHLVILGALLFLIAELFYIKYRGDV